MFKKIFFVLFTLFFISSCSNNDALESTGLIKNETATLSIDLPVHWEVISDINKILPKIQNGKIELAVTSKNVSNGFSNNLLILSDKLENITSSKEFSMLNNVGASSEYINYKKLESKDILFSDEEISIVYIFEAKYNLDTPRLKFLQTARVCNQNQGFLLTIALPTSIDDTSKYEHLLSTFACK